MAGAALAIGGLPRYKHALRRAHRSGLNVRFQTIDPRRPETVPKLKSKSGAKKRFRATAGGKVRANHAFKRHNLRKRSTKMKRSTRRGFILSKSDSEIVKKYLPYL